MILGEQQSACCQLVLGASFRSQLVTTSQVFLLMGLLLALKALAVSI